MIQRLISLGLFLALWVAGSWLAGDPGTFPSPLAVAKLIISEAASGDLAYHLTATLLRVIAAFVLALAAGMALGYVMGRSRKLDLWMDGWLVVLLNLPALVTIVLCYIWIGLTEVAAITAVALNKIPMVTVMIREGVRALDPKLDDMARIYRLSPWDRMRHVVMPQLAPHVASASRTGIALIWKIVLVVEFLGRSNGVGFQIHLHFQLFDVGMVLAYAFAFIAVMLLVEAFALRPLERSASRWRTG